MGGTIALVRRPGERLGEGRYTSGTPVDLDLARRQHDELIQTLTDLGVQIQVVRSDESLPDAVFVSDLLVIRGGLAILARPAESGRTAEIAEVEKAVRELGLEVVRVGPPGTLDGCDVIQTAGIPFGEAVYVGRSDCTSWDAACRLPGVASTSTRALGIHRVIPVTVTGCSQLAAAMTALPDGTLFGDPDRVDTAALPGLRVAPETTGPHLLTLDGGHIVLTASAPRTAALLRAEGYQVTTVDISQYEALGAILPSLVALVPPQSESSG